MGMREIPAHARVLDPSSPSLTLRTRDPEIALLALADRGCSHVWLEGGPTLASAFVRAGLVDRVIGYVAPALIGGGAPVIADLGVRTLGQSARLSLVDVTRLGDDVRITMDWGSGRRPERGPGAGRGQPRA
jgi:diaminohydroxyphosphoribosylaminopyrimidine deaminase/5-amino-6-(5-phosphoribosylamino)uracil reductase